MKALAGAAFILVIAAGCGKGVATESTSTVLGHIHGTFILQAGPVPTCGTPGTPPACEAFTQPIADARITVLNSTGQRVVVTTTNAQGVFDASLGPGTYRVEAPSGQEPGTYQQTVVLTAGGTVDVALHVSEP